MKKFIYLSFVLLTFSSFSFLETTYVYICKGPNSKVYHKSEHCNGLSHCSTQIYKVTIEECKKLGRRPCKIEYR